MTNNEEFQKFLDEISYGEIRVLAMENRGAYAEPEEETAKSTDANFSEFLNEDEDLLLLKRSDDFEPLDEEDFNRSLAQLDKPQHLIIVDCLVLGTTEIRAFLLKLLDEGLLEKSKLLLLDLPELEYLTLKEALTSKIKF
ncbi:hypothetical protein [Lactococcus termiticola]|nr:hypothetical protein [Lactococcus termiticola]